MADIALSWLKTHERLIVVALALLAGSWGLNHFLNNAAAKAETRATIAEQALSAQKVQDAQNASQTASVLAQYQSMVTALSAQNASLAAAAASRQAILTKDKATDATLALPLLGSKLQTLGNAPEGTVSTTSNSVNLTQPGAVAVVQTLEELPVVKANLSDEVMVAANLQTEVSKSNAVIAAQDTQIAGLNLTSTEQDKTCKLEIAKVNADARKSKLKWFKWGFLTGFLSGAYVGHII
jgi:hypothetical protein